MPPYATSERADDPSLARIGAFSDGVFAFAITLLVLTIRIPHPSDTDAATGLLTLLTQQWRNFMAFVLSFMLVGINCEMGSDPKLKYNALVVPEQKRADLRRRP